MKTKVDGDILTVFKSLRRNGFDARIAPDSEAALKMLLDIIPKGALVGFGDSLTVRGVGLFDRLSDRDTTVVRPIINRTGKLGSEDDTEYSRIIGTLKKRLTNDIFVSGTNAVTMDGKIVNIDGTGNRVTGMVFAAPKVVLVIGRNKIVKDADEAIYRIKNTIAPAWGKLKGSILPCVKTGRCHDCNTRSPSRRRCNVTTIVERRPAYTDVVIVLVNEDLGLGWNPAWPRERINGIIRKCIQDMNEGPTRNRYKGGDAFLDEIKADGRAR